MWRSKLRKKYDFLCVALDDARKSRDQAEERAINYSRNWYECRIKNIRLQKENARLRDALEQIAGATMSQYASVDDMARDIKRKAREALSNGEKSTQENNGR
ncbi:hypothetical protein JNUCC32_31255 (plasmid) [Paenibacillus sp. JNUCC32]|uniref:hypothetical protein n=1 Tax=Paenibacillus sp. JNUCC32 TaxID=2777984 RepID=UPI001787D122|nr:hypothetical protein [Paenibacillus sp. JNUCC-32]QOT13679.1 hypothetical protein JNUCC32_31255 [Paenibacillus sp. JNUCC-32]